MPVSGKSGLWAGTAALTLCLCGSPASLAQEPPAAAPAAPADDAAKAAEAAGAKAFAAGAAAYDRREYQLALDHYAQALAHFGKAWPESADTDRARAVRLQVRRARAFAQGRLGNVDGFLAEARIALRLIGVLGGEGGEEQALQAALFECLRAVKDLGPKLRLLNGYRTWLEQSLPANATGDQGLTRRLKMQIGQVHHEIAFAQDRAGKLEEAAATLAVAIDYRRRINDLGGMGWSSQNLFWNLLRRRELEAAAKQFGETVRILHRGPNVDVEGSLVRNLEEWIAARAKEGKAKPAQTLLAALRATGALQEGDLASFTFGRACALELALTKPGLEATRALRLQLATGLILAGGRESQPAWRWLGRSTRARTALELTAEARAAAELDPETDARAAVEAAKELKDPHRTGLAQLLLADVYAGAGRLDDSEGQIAAVLADASRPGGEPWLRELARRTGAKLAARAEKPEWTQRYTLHASPKSPGTIAGHTIMGRDRRAFLRDLATLPGEGPVVTITRRGAHLIIRSPFYPGSLAVEWSWRLRYVNANGILLAVQGPAVAVIGTRDDVSAPSASSGTVREDGQGGLALRPLMGDRLPPLASQAAIPDGESAFINKYLRVFR